ncbi:MAG TPA: NUDIX domain-containing protein, partial [Burkholderiaceae bacterium]
MHAVSATPQRWKPNVTVAAVVEQAGRFLLVEEDTADGLKLNTPAGHLELAESPLQAVVREVLEETGRQFHPSAFLGAYMSRVLRQGTQEDITYLRLAYCGTVSAPLAGQVLDTGIVRTLWMTPEELRDC